MKKQLLLATVSALLLAGCSSDGYIGDPLATQTSGEITFSQTVPNVTRASGTSADAAKLGNNFVVYGFKMDNTATEAVNGSTDKKVFDLYNVKYTSGTANSTLSNTNNWEYVGYTSVGGAAQTIKYWDFNSKYVFSAISCGAGVTFTKITDAATIAGTTVNDKGWQLTVPAGTTLSNLYASDRKAMTKSLSGGKYSFGTVDFTFYSLASQIRFAMYETVPGYSVKIDKVYYNSTNSTTYFGVDGTFKGITGSGNTTLNIIYDGSNRPVLSYDNESTTTYMAFGANLLSATALGTASNAATYDQADGSYSLILPYESKAETTPAENILSLKLDYTLTSTDGSGEEIKVYGATATVPTAYTQWKNNYAYTYMFKISDNTSGSTGGDPNDPKGLYPVTFDACIAATADGNAQETITTIADPSITTYQSGQVITSNDEYKAGTVTVTIYDPTIVSGNPIGDVSLTKSNLKLYTAISSGTAITEKNVENYKNNDIVLTDVSNAIAGYSTLNAKSANFTAVSGYTYVVEYTKDTKKYYKVIKVTGTAPTIVYKFLAYEDAAAGTELDPSQIEEGGTFYVTVQQMVGSVEGAVTAADKKFHADTQAAFTITETATPGTYAFQAKAGTSGVQTVKINGTGDTSVDVTINAYEFDSSSITVIGDANDTETSTLKLGTAAVTTATAADFACSTGLTVTDVTDGVLIIEAAKTAKSGTVTYSHGGVVVATLDVTVQHYSYLAPTRKTINIGSIVDAEKTSTITMKLGGAALAQATDVTVSSSPAANVLASYPTATNASGEVTLTAGTAVGTATVKAPDDTEISIEVKNFTVTSNTATGATRTITFKNNGTTENVALAVSAGTLTKTAASGAYNWTGITENATVTYTYNGETFTLYKATGI